MSQYTYKGVIDLVSLKEVLISFCQAAQIEMHFSCNIFCIPRRLFVKHQALGVAMCMVLLTDVTHQQMVYGFVAEFLHPTMPLCQAQGFALMHMQVSQNVFRDISIQFVTWFLFIPLCQNSSVMTNMKMT